MTLGLTLLSLICLYLALVNEFFLYLETRHPQTWHELGKPWPWSASPGDILSSVKFVFFGGALRLWHDRGLRVRLIGVWASFAAALAVLIFSKSIDS
jgi:hypothetical protein